jgi:hypothetical protein
LHLLIIFSPGYFDGELVENVNGVHLKASALNLPFLLFSG